jgi:hypothetical protein
MSLTRLLNFTRNLPLIFILSTACGQTPTGSVLDAFDIDYLQAGDTKIKIYTFEEPEQGNSKFYTYLNVHYNETTSVTAAKKVVQQHGGRIFVVTNPQDRRNLKFSSEGQSFEVDPNRIFTDRGIHDSLIKWSNRAPEHAIVALQQYRERYLEFTGLTQNSTETAIALHNNTNDSFSLASFLPGGSDEASAQRVHQSRKAGSISHDLDDFFYLTDATQYEVISARDNNSVLQNNEAVLDDGSLSVWSGRNNVRYVNVEAENGHESIQYQQLLELQQLPD